LSLEHRFLIEVEPNSVDVLSIALSETPSTTSVLLGNNNHHSLANVLSASLSKITPKASNPL
jgi:hypothetical protein